MIVPGLADFTEYLRNAGWVLDDDDGRTTLWRPLDVDENDIRVVLPTNQEVRDYSDRAMEALRAVAFVERRLPQETATDMRYGGADNVSVRLAPDVPSGEAPLFLAYTALTALRSYVIASAASLEYKELVLPPRRLSRAESYASQTRVSTQAGSFILSLALPLKDTYDSINTDPHNGQEVIAGVPGDGLFGRRVTNRMLLAAETAQKLARSVSEGDTPLSVFGEVGGQRINATELEALGSLGGPDRDVYQIRFAQSPMVAGTSQPRRLRITPGEQRILHEAADFLRTRQPRANVTVIGLVVRLFREGKFGKGEVVIQGVDDDTGQERRVRVELAESDYNVAVNAHKQGLQVSAVGDLDVRGTRRSLRHLSSFSVIPGLEEY
ncbi:hypothetical protein [Herbidospora sp. NBRC 101105]|uniref:hypothetical protein n=1 Tax=Herbidospora sp. NBRC 101105 TaxID=3032195 RepID=UPI0025575E80|nr:hypothetical protein [Herbidospora sp. NBRC 101105]